jgi:TatD DNase family protein
VIDSHAHLDYFDDPAAAVAAAVDAGVRGVIAIGCGVQSLESTLAIARQHEDRLRVVGGVHPQKASTFDMADWDKVRTLLDDPLVVGIGETGFDYYRDYGPTEPQDPVFEMQAQLARERDLPLVIHTRAADQHTLDALARHADGLRVVLHCFSMSERVDDVIERGYWCSFAGNVTYRSAEDLRAAASRIPAERLLVETDAPYLAPVPMRGKQNSPALVRHTAECIAKVRGLSVAEVDELTTRNAVELFGLPESMA